MDDDGDMVTHIVTSTKRLPSSQQGLKINQKPNMSGAPIRNESGQDLKSPQPGPSHQPPGLGLPFNQGFIQQGPPQNKLPNPQALGSSISPGPSNLFKNQLIAQSSNFIPLQSQVKEPAQVYPSLNQSKPVEVKQNMQPGPTNPKPEQPQRSIVFPGTTVNNPAPSKNNKKSSSESNSKSSSDSESSVSGKKLDPHFVHNTGNAGFNKLVDYSKQALGFPKNTENPKNHNLEIGKKIPGQPEPYLEPSKLEDKPAFIETLNGIKDVPQKVSIKTVENSKKPQNLPQKTNKGPINVPQVQNSSVENDPPNQNSSAPPLINKSGMSIHNSSANRDKNSPFYIENPEIKPGTDENHSKVVSDSRIGAAVPGGGDSKPMLGPGGSNPPIISSVLSHGPGPGGLNPAIGQNVFNSGQVPGFINPDNHEIPQLPQTPQEKPAFNLDPARGNQTGIHNPANHGKHQMFPPAEKPLNDPPFMNNRMPDPFLQIPYDPKKNELPGAQVFKPIDSNQKPIKEPEKADLNPPFKQNFNPQFFNPSEKADLNPPLKQNFNQQVLNPFAKVNPPKSNQDAPKSSWVPQNQIENPLKEEVKKNEVSQSLIFRTNVHSPSRQGVHLIPKKPTEGFQRLDRPIPKNEINIEIIKVNQDRILKSQSEVINFLSRTIDFNKLIKNSEENLQFLAEKTRYGSEECKKVLDFFNQYLQCSLCNERNSQLLIELKCKTIICRTCLKGSAEQALERKFFECPHCKKVIDQEEQESIWNDLNIRPETIEREKLENKFKSRKQLKCKKCERYKKNYWTWCLHLCKECFAEDIRKHIVPCLTCHDSVNYEKILNETFICSNCESEKFFVGYYAKYVDNETKLLCVQCVYDYFNQGIIQKLRLTLTKTEKVEINYHLFRNCAACSEDIFQDYLELSSCGHLICKSCKGIRPCRICSIN